MAYRQFQTAAARVVHVVQPTDGDIERLAADYHFHPLDLEAVLGVSPKPRVGSYRHYVVASLPWPVLDPRRRHIVMSELQLFIGPNYLVVAEDGIQTEIRDIIAEWERQDANADQPFMLAYELLLRLMKSTAAASRAIPAAQWTAALQPLVAGLEQLRQRFIDQGWLEHEESRNAFAYLIYTAKHMLDTLARLPIPAATRPVKRSLAQSAVAGYAIASAIMTVVVLLIISFGR